MRLFAALGLIALVACSAAFTLGVADFSVPIANTLGRTCWVKVDTSGSPVIRTATYLADATYDPGAVALSDSVTVQFFGRREAPADTCTAGGEVDDLPLSAPSISSVKRVSGSRSEGLPTEKTLVAWSTRAFSGLALRPPATWV